MYHCFVRSSVMLDIFPTLSACSDRLPTTSYGRGAQCHPRSCRAERAEHPEDEPVQEQVERAEIQAERERGEDHDEGRCVDLLLGRPRHPAHLVADLGEKPPGTAPPAGDAFLGPSSE